MNETDIRYFDSLTKGSYIFYANQMCTVFSKDLVKGIVTTLTPIGNKLDIDFKKLTSQASVFNKRNIVLRITLFKGKDLIIYEGIYYINKKVEELLRNKVPYTCFIENRNKFFLDDSISLEEMEIRKDAYISYHSDYLVTRSAESGKNGFNNTWVDTMDSLINRIIRVETREQGAEVTISKYGWEVPYYILDKQDSTFSLLTFQFSNGYTFSIDVNEHFVLNFNSCDKFSISK